MNLHLGRTKSPGRITFLHDGYWYRGAGDTDYSFIKYDAPQPKSRTVRRMWGVSMLGVFVGVMRFGDPED